MRAAVSTKARALHKTKSLPAPVRGWIENENLAKNGGAGASVLENWFPLQATVRVRGGALRVAVVPGPVVSLVPYSASGINKLFACTQGEIYDVSLLNAQVEPAPDVSGFGSGHWSHIQFGTAGGNFLLMVNGLNYLRLYDGLTWTAINEVSTPAITGVNTQSLSHIWMHGNRVWAVETSTLNAWYLSVDSIAGAAEKFALAGVFKRGGALLFGETWSVDSGDGMDDRQVFVTDQGEVAVYEGIDPSDAATWRLVGRYDIGKPVSTRTMRAGGDLLIATVDGIVPLSAVVGKDPAALSLSAITRRIEPSWHRQVRAAGATQFEMIKWPREGMGIIALPHTGGLEAFVVNMQTGAWAKWTGLDMQCLALYNDLAYYGGTNGRVYQLEGAGADGGEPYTCRYSGLPDHLGAMGAYKEVTMARAVFLASVPFEPRLSIAPDYRTTFPSAPNASEDVTTEALWDVGIWDVDYWDDADTSAKNTITSKWRSVVASGFSAGPQVQITCGGRRTPDAELVAFDIAYLPGNVIV